MPSYTEIDLEVCLVCAHLVVNGEFTNGTDAAKQAQKGIDKKWGRDQVHISVTDGGEDFSTRDCDACGDGMHGERHNAVALIPK